jgi:hypothetical protein
VNAYYISFQDLQSSYLFSKKMKIKSMKTVLLFIFLNVTLDPSVEGKSVG